MSKDMNDKELDKLLEEELMQEAELIEKSLLGEDADDQQMSEGELDKSYERLVKRLKAEGLYQDYEGESQSAEIVRFPGSHRNTFSEEAEALENSEEKEVTEKLIPSWEIEKRKKWDNMGKVAGFFLLCALSILAGSMASQADKTNFTATIEHIINDGNNMP